MYPSHAPLFKSHTHPSIHLPIHPPPSSRSLAIHPLMQSPPGDVRQGVPELPRHLEVVLQVRAEGPLVAPGLHQRLARHGLPAGCVCVSTRGDELSSRPINQSRGWLVFGPSALCARTTRRRAPRAAPRAGPGRAGRRRPPLAPVVLICVWWCGWGECLPKSVDGSLRSSLLIISYLHGRLDVVVPLEGVKDLLCRDAGCSVRNKIASDRPITRYIYTHTQAHAPPPSPSNP
jgi:hypothetical protein